MIHVHEQMERQEELSVTFDVNPGDMQHGVSMHKMLNILVSERFSGKIYNGAVIDAVLDTSITHDAKVLSNGSVRFIVKALCNVCRLNVGDVTNIEITAVSKMGYVYKRKRLTVLIPRHMAGDEEYAVGDIVPVNIVGKRIEDNVVCVASAVTQEA